MNILLYVIVLIIILATLSYERVSNFLNTSLTRKQWQEYMQKDERAEQHLHAEKLYNITVVKNGSASDKTRVDSTAFVNLDWLINPQKRESKPQVAESLRELTRNLMVVLFSDEPFFKEAQQNNPEFLDQILNTLQNPHDANGLPLTIKTSDDLSYIAWENHQLHHIFNQMLTENYASTPPKVSVPMGPIFEEETESPNPDDHRDIEDHKSLKGFVTFDPRYKIRVYRAPKEVLIAVFGSPEIADEIMLASRKLYLDVLRGKSPDDAKEEFRGQFVGSAPAQFADLLDFTVNKTSPDEFR